MRKLLLGFEDIIDRNISLGLTCEPFSILYFWPIFRNVRCYRILHRRQRTSLHLVFFWFLFCRWREKKNFLFRSSDTLTKQSLTEKTKPRFSGNKFLQLFRVFEICMVVCIQAYFRVLVGFLSLYFFGAFERPCLSSSEFALSNIFLASLILWSSVSVPATHGGSSLLSPSDFFPMTLFF